MRREIVAGTLLVGLAHWSGAQTKAPAVWEQEPTAYRGIPWGAEPRAAADSIEKGKSPISGKCFCAVGHECPPTKAIDPPPAQRHCFSEISVAGVTLNETWTFTVDHFAGVSMRFDSDNYDRMRAMFVQRYGPPTTTEHTPFKTRGGLEATNEELSWDGPIAAVRLTHFGGKITEGRASVVTKALLDEFSKEQKEREAEGAKVF